PGSTRPSKRSGVRRTRHELGARATRAPRAIVSALESAGGGLPGVHQGPASGAPALPVAPSDACPAPSGTRGPTSALQRPATQTRPSAQSSARKQARFSALGEADPAQPANGPSPTKPTTAHPAQRPLMTISVLEPARPRQGGQARGSDRQTVSPR